jgi:hypothetical protein
MENTIDDIVVIVPSYEPDEKLITLLNDGSAPKYDPFFQLALDKYHCRVLRHHVNLGKGRALKTAFNEVLNSYPDCLGAITVDSDGQHKVNDVIACCAALRKQPSSLIFGVRSFLKNKEDYGVAGLFQGNFEENVADQRGTFRIRNEHVDRNDGVEHSDCRGADRDGLHRR